MASANGKLYVIGGSANATAVFAYDPSRNTWSTKSFCPSDHAFRAVAVYNGIIYVIGGSGGTNTAGSVYAYNPVTDSWAGKASMPIPRVEAAAGVINGII